MRIGGVFIDGNSGVLAYNYFPDYGDMVLDTGDGNFYDNPGNNFGWIVIGEEGVNKTARRTVLRSSRTLPGQS